MLPYFAKSEDLPTYQAFLEPAMERANPRVITHAQVEKILLVSGASGLRATGVRYRDVDGRTATLHADKEVVVSAGAIGSPQLLLLSGIGPSEELASVGVECVLANPHVGKHLKDPPARADGVPGSRGGAEDGRDRRRARTGRAARPGGPPSGRPGRRRGPAPELPELKAEAERQVLEWATTGRGLASSSFYDAVAFFSTGLGDLHTHDAQVGLLACGYTPDIWRRQFRVDPGDFFSDPDSALAADAATVVVLPNPVPPALAAAHGHTVGEPPSDALLEDIGRHYALTVYHETSTCRMGSVVDAELRVLGVAGPRVADAT